MIQNIPYSFNKMAPYKAPSNPTPVPPVDPDLIWYMDFSDGFYQSYSNISGVATNNQFSIETDQTMGKYLQCTATSNNNVSWSGSKDYLNNLIAGTTSFSVSFWLRAPQWTSKDNQIVICWKYDDSNTGLVFYRDGGNASKLDGRLSYQNNFFTSTDVENQDWVHWVFVRDSNGAYWYRNGVLDSSNNTYGSYDNTASKDINIGYCNAWGCNAVFDVTKYRIYKRALTQAEAEELYTNKA